MDLIDKTFNAYNAARFREAMDDDFNTPEAVAVLFELANELNKSHTREHAQLLKSLGGTLGLLQRDATAFLQAVPSHATGSGALTGGANLDGAGSALARDPDDARIDALIEARQAARAVDTGASHPSL